MKSDLLTVRSAADLLGISTSTFKRICDSESIPVIRTPGGHRRVERADVDRLAQTLNLSKRKASASSVTSSGLSVERLIDELLAGQSETIAKLLLQHAASPLNLIRLLEDYLIAALWKIGERWRNQELEIHHEHLCTNVALTAIDQLRSRLPLHSKTDLVAVGGSLSPCTETLPSKIISLCFEISGVRAIDLGGLVPAASLAKAAAQWNASWVWTTHTHITDGESALVAHQRLRELLPSGVRILIGGGGMSPAIRRSLPWCIYYETLSQMIEMEVTRRRLE